MPYELKQPKYFKPDAAKPGDTVFIAGEYIKEVQGQLGPQFKFRTVEGKIDHVISGGVIKYKVGQGDIHKGGVYDIIYEGKEKIKKGKFKGKDVVNYKVLAYSPEEMEGMSLEYRAPSAPVTSEEDNSLDDLE